MSELDNNKRVVKNSVLLAVRMVIVTLISIFTTRFLLKNLGVEDFGVYNVTLGLVALCTFLSPAFSNAIQRYFNFELGKNGEDGAKQVFNSSLQIQIALVFLLVIICETIGRWYVIEKLVVPDGRQDAALWVFHISVIALSLSMLQVPFVASILAHEKMNFYAIVNIIDAVFKLIISIAIAFASFDRLVFYGLLLLGVNIADFFLYSVYSFRQFKEIRLDFTFNKALLKGLLSFSGWNLFETVARVGKDQGGSLLLNSFFGPILNAARGVTNQVSYAFSSIVDSTVMASRPQMVIEYAKGNYQRSLSLFYSLSKGTLLLLYMLSLPVFLDTEYILKLWLGSNIPMYSVELIRLSIVFLLIDKLAAPITAIVHATGRIKRYHMISGILNILVLPVTWVLFSFGYSALFLYIVMILAALIAQLLFLFVLRDLLPFSITTYCKKVCMPFLYVLIISTGVPYIIESNMNEGIIRLAVVTLSSLIIVSITTFFLSLTNKEKELLLALLKRS